MTMWGGMGGGPGRENNAWMKLMGIVHTGPRGGQGNEKAINA